MTQFFAVNAENAAVFEFGSGFTFESAYEYILKAEAECYPEAEFMPGFDFIFVDDDGDEYIFEMGCWAPRDM
jgi:hypothetical protein